MDILEKRPLAAFSSSFYICACVFFSADRSFRTLFSFAALILLVLSIICSGPLWRRGIGRGLTALFAGMLAASLFSGIAVDVIYREAHDDSVTHTGVEGTIVEVNGTSSFGGRYILQAKDGSTLLMNCDNGELSVGDLVAFDAELSPVEVSEDYKYQLFSRGIFRSADAVGEVEFRGKTNGMKLFFGHLRDKLSSVFTAEMSKRAGGFSAALLLGDRGLLEDSITRDFKCLGISHILSLSGTHLTVLFLLVGRLIPDKTRLRYPRFAVISLGIVFYMFLTGFSASVVRSGVMLIFNAAADLLNRKHDSFTSLSAAVLLICIADPLAPFDMGLQLSYLSVAGLIMSNAIYRKTAPRKRLVKSLIPAIIVPSVTLPLSWLRFGSVSLVSPVANIIFVPVITVFIPILAVTLILSPLRAIFVPFTGFLDTVITFILDIIEAFASSSDFLLPLNGTVITATVAVFTILFTGTVVFSGNRRKILGMSAAIVLSVTLFAAQLNARWTSNVPTAYCVLYARDDAASVISGGHSLVIDAGMGSSATKKAAELSVGYGRRVNSLMLTHLHRSHITTLRKINSSFYLDTLWLPLPDNTEEKIVFDALKDEAKFLGVTVNTYLEGEILQFGDFTLKSPKSIRSDEHKHDDIVFSLEHPLGRLMYGNGFDSSDSSDSTVLFYGSHVALQSEDIAHGKGITAPSNATKFDTIEESVTIADKVRILWDKEMSAEAVTE